MKALEDTIAFIVTIATLAFGFVTLAAASALCAGIGGVAMEHNVWDRAWYGNLAILALMVGVPALALTLACSKACEWFREREYQRLP
jgi:hypothetical protein